MPLTAPRKCYRITFDCPACHHAWTEQRRDGLESDCPQCGLPWVDPADWIEISENEMD